MKKIACLLKKTGEVWIAFLLMAGVMLSRWFWRAPVLNSFDAINYALAVDHFDVRLHQTQPPGYFLYIVGVRLVNFFVHNPPEALTIFSTLASALGVWFAYLVGRDIFGRRAGLIGALFLSVSTVFWYHGEIAAPYTGDMALSALAAWLCWRASKGQARDVYLAALVLGIAGAYRPQTMFFVGPLLVFALWGRSWKLWLAAGLITGASAALLFSPAIFASGGPRAYVNAVFNLTGNTTSEHQATYGYWRYLGYVVDTARAGFATLGEAIIMSVFLGWVAARQQKRENIFLFLWVIPTLAVFCLVYPGNPGTILVCITPFFIWAGRGFDALLIEPKGKWLAWGLLSFIVGWQIILFALLPYNGLRYRLLDNLDNLKLDVRYFQTSLDMIAELPAAETLVLTYNYRHFQYYLPEYTACSKPVSSVSEPQTIQKLTCVKDNLVTVQRNLPATGWAPAGTRYIAIFSIPIEEMPASASWLQKRTRDEFSIWVMEIPAGQQVTWQKDGLVLAP